MGELPPKAPVAMTSNWSSANSFPFQILQPSSNSWVDEFLDFSSMRRSAHRRTVSDPIAFAEAGPMNFAEKPRIGGGFERLDDEQLRSMFSDEAAAPVTASSSNPSSHSDQQSEENEEGEKKSPPVVQPKVEPGEVDSSCRPGGEPPLPPAKLSGETIVDPKRIKRILANRQSAQRSRVRKLQYITELERSVTTLQAEVSTLSPRVAFLDHQRLLLNVDNSALKQRIAALAQDKIFKDAHQEALKKEIERLRKIYHEQTTKKMEADAGAPPPPSDPEERDCTDEQ